MISLPFAHQLWGAPVTELADYINAHMIAEGWSRQEAAKRAGISKTAITNIVNNKQQPSKETIAKIARGWGLSLDYLLELAGLPRAQAGQAEQATAGLTSDQLAFLAGLTPEQRRRLIDAGRHLLSDEPLP
jgi:transcriptional regulator with XRE-family HTH domain